MTVAEARQLVRDFDEGKIVSEEEEFVFIEAMEFLIDKEHNPGDMMYLGGYYYEKKLFDLALKYYEMAATFDYEEAYECLGYIWYYGRTGEKDYKKAFTYFQKLREKGHLVATYKVADMYKNGFYVEKNQEEYEKIIENLFPKVQQCRNVFDPIPEVYTRLAKIRVNQGRKDEAINLYLYAKRVLAQRIQLNGFFGNLSIMKYLIEDLYKLIDFDEDFFDLFDLFFLLKKPHKVVFHCDEREYVIQSEYDGAECAVCMNGRWFHDCDEFFAKACVGDKRITTVGHELYGFHLIE